jgi:hypothetical protein
MEEGLKNNPEVELDDDGFTTLSFRTHPDAYWDAGLNDIPFWDKVKVAWTPDISEWLDGRTWEQVYDIGERKLRKDSDDFKQKMRSIAKEISSDVREMIRTMYE